MRAGMILLVFGAVLSAQDPVAPPSVSEKWHVFEHEAFSPLMFGAAGINSSFSQAIHSSPLYGRHPWPTAYPKRFGAAVGDILSEDFFSDFLLASAFHEDTRYVRRGSTHKFWGRVAYAISRSAVTRTDSGAETFNWANVFGSAMSAGLSNAYYPPASRTARAAARNWGTTFADSGLANLVPELWPDLRRWLKGLAHH